MDKIKEGDFTTQYNLAIIIPVFNKLKFTQKCLESLNALIYSPELTEIEFQVIVVDDGSKDGTAEWIKENYPKIHLLFGDGNLWWSGGVNLGVDYALNSLNADYVLWWNNDIEPSPDYFINAQKLIVSNNNDTLIGSKIFTLDKKIIWGMGGKFDPINGHRYMYGGLQADTENFRKPLEVDWFPGMGTFIHRKVYEKIGMLDEEEFPQYHGDSDFTYRARKAGFRLIAFPDLIIYNDTSNTGLIHQGSVRKLYSSLISRQSNFNIKKELTFYKKHAKSSYAYFYIVKKYFRYIGGFYKWKFLNFLGIKKSHCGKEIT